MSDQNRTIVERIIFCAEALIENHYEYTLPDIVGKPEDSGPIDTTDFRIFANRINNIRAIIAQLRKGDWSFMNAVVLQEQFREIMEFAQEHDC